ncbi:MAG TPA: hypothetical protein VMG30_07795 [Acidobacteriota bacterium]|nr:hypothetical protein [Acidobacteriota bacterium]
MTERLQPPSFRNPKISHREILQATVRFSGFADLYREKVLTQQTRTIRLLGTKCSAKILHTLLGFEVQARYKRIQCPDMVTARYIRLFSELGCHSIKLPYDPTRTAQLIPEFEAMLERIADRIRAQFPGDRSTQRYVFQKVYAILRRQLRAA